MIAFINLGVFVAVFNYLGFRLMDAPHHLSQGQLSALFTVYLFGVVLSPLGGAAADRFGRARVMLIGLITSALGVTLTLSMPLPGVVLGVALLTCGFFVTHAVASGWVGLAAPDHRGHASALYLLAYYLGSSVVGLAGGWFWTAGGWTWVAAFTAALLLLALGVARSLPSTA
ncbi:MFS transporter [Deinococcus sonorensis]|uniref:MFS transporter n=2 Tax=Deinococcus sonorensis TaxID=309891 RepID=A0AAU7U5X6_9DEIO